MAKIEARGTQPADSSDWNHAWSVIAQLAAARGAALREFGQEDAGRSDVAAAVQAADAMLALAVIDDDALPSSRHAHAELVGSLLAADTLGADVQPEIPAPLTPVAPDQLARDIAEIEQAAAALRRTEPALVPQIHPSAQSSEPPERHSVWLLVGVIWLTAVAVVSCTVCTAALLLN